MIAKCSATYWNHICISWRSYLALINIQNTWNKYSENAKSCKAGVLILSYIYDLDFCNIFVGYVILFISNLSLYLCIHNVKRNFTDKPWNNVYLCKLILDKRILQWHAIYRMHNNIKSIGVECIGICSPYSTHRHSRLVRLTQLRHVKYP